MFKRLLIANRGEIACRIMRTCRRLGIETIAVYASVDAGSRHVAEADYAVAIGGASARDSYLRADRIVSAALASGAQAVHPGYGFLSEKLELIDACQASGLTFVGPHRRAIEAMGSKIESKRIARAAGLLCVPGYDGDDASPQRLLDEARRIGFPLLIKASAGGGGKGMRRVNAERDFLDLLSLARLEALASFGDDRVLLEKYLLRPRHLEVQLMGDRHGGLVHLFERECSIQRRFQKVIEEAPAHHLLPSVAGQLHEAALRMGRAMAYDNAGTVEFVLDADDGDRPYFLEVNTRLQVEHGVTEVITGIDLVEWQLRSAFGEPLPLQQDAIGRRGWAIECRLNAEEPEHDYRASLGPLLGYAEPRRSAGLRIDSGLHAHSEVTPYYDSMLAKLIGSGPTRGQALQEVRAGLEQLRVEGVKTNAALLLQILGHPAFDGVLSTGFLEQHFPHGPEPEAELRQQQILGVAAAWAASQTVTTPVWGALRGFRLTAPAGQPARIALRLGEPAEAGDSLALQLLHIAGGYESPVCPGWHATVAARPDAWVVKLTREHEPACEVHIRRTAPHRWFSWARGRSRLWCVEHELEHSLHGSRAESAQSQLSATLPGRISEVLVRRGDVVAAGAPVLTLEAMKLYHTLGAPLSGVVQSVHVQAGDIVAHGQLLVEFEAQADDAPS